MFDPTASKPIIHRDLARAKCNPKAGQIVISRASGTARHVGACVFIDKDYPNRFLPDKLWQTVPKPGINTDMKWLFYVLTSQKIKTRIVHLATGTNIKNVTQSELLSIPISIPPYIEQTAIADLLSTWDEAIEKTEKLIAEKERQFSWLAQRLIRARVGKWKHFKVKKMFKPISEKKNGDCELLSVTQDRGVIPRSMLRGRVMSPQGSTDSYKLIKKGDFAISLRSFQGGIEYSEYQGVISPAYTVLRPIVELHDDFYRHFFKSRLFVEKYLSIAVIGIRDGKQVSIPDFMTVKIPYPPLHEQKSIATDLNTAQQELSLLTSLVATYRKQKCGLMQKLLAGVWRVKPEIAKKHKGTQG